MERQARLIISDGGVTGLLAAAARAEGRGAETVLWHQVREGTARKAMEGAVRRQAELYGVLLDVAPSGGGEGGGAEGDLLVLYRAGVAAAKRGLGEAVWPVSAGLEFDLATVTRNCDRALLVSRIVALDVGAGACPVFVTPYADLTDAQIADLILDMDLPIWTCWWYEGGTPGAEAERERWTAALRTAGWKGALPGPEVVTKAGVSGRAAAL